MKTLAFCRKNRWVIQNHRLAIHSDKYVNIKNTLKYLPTYLADLPNQSKYLDIIKKKLSLSVPCQWNLYLQNCGNVILKGITG